MSPDYAPPKKLRVTSAPYRSEVEWPLRSAPHCDLRCPTQDRSRWAITIDLYRRQTAIHQKLHPFARSLTTDCPAANEVSHRRAQAQLTRAGPQPHLAGRH